VTSSGAWLAGSTNTSNKARNEGPLTRRGSGQEAETRAEVAEVLRISPNFSLEVLRRMAPVKDQEELERFLDLLRKAGLK